MKPAKSLKTDREIVSETYDLATRDKDFARHVSKWHHDFMVAKWIYYYMKNGMN